MSAWILDYNTLKMWGAPGMHNRAAFVNAFEFADKCVERQRKKKKAKKKEFDTTFIKGSLNDDLSIDVECTKSGEKRTFPYEGKKVEIKDPNSWYERNKERLKQERLAENDPEDTSDSED